jgi:IclR family acetate operon transcriptional repressor
MRRLMEATGETANLGIADQGFIVFISQIETQNPIRAMFRAGARSQMHASGIGKAMLAHMPRDAVIKLIEANGLPEFTPQTLINPDTLFSDLDNIASRGWAFDSEERYTGMCCIASAVFDGQGAPIAGVSVSGPSARFTDELIAKAGPLVREAAAEITTLTGG